MPKILTFHTLTVLTYNNHIQFVVLKTLTVLNSIQIKTTHFQKPRKNKGMINILGE